MPDHKQVYRQQAEEYEALVSREDRHHHILQAVLDITPLAGKDVVELGAGTGCLTCLLAPLARSIQAYDISEPMLALAAAKLKRSGLTNWRAAVSDHRSLPAPDQCADIAISGWSICYLADWSGAGWRDEVLKALAEMRRVLRPGGVIILIETLGTGFETPTPPTHLLPYYDLLKEQGFTSTWMRTDYEFDSTAQGRELAAFFFGEDMALKIGEENGRGILAECTGIWRSQVT